MVACPHTRTSLQNRFAAHWATAVLLAVLIGQPALAANRVDTPHDTRIVLRDAERLLELGHVEQARRLLQPRADALGPEAPLSSGFHRVLRLLGQTHLAAKQYDRAEAMATACRNYLARFADPSGDLIAERQDVALLLAAAHEARGRWKDCATFLQEALELDAMRPRAEPAWRIDVLKRWSDASAKAGDTSRLKEAAEQIEAHVASVETRYRQRQISLTRYDQAVSAFARFLTEQNRPDEAIVQWQRLLEIYETANDTSRQAEIWSQIAAGHEAAKNDPALIRALERCAAMWRTEAERLSKLQIAVQPLWLAQFQVAQADRKLGQALASAGDRSSGDATLQASQQALAALVGTLNERQAELQSVDGPSSNAVSRLMDEEIRFIEAFTLAVLQELKTVRELLASQQYGPDADGADGDLKISQQIHDLSARLYPDDDPRVYHAKLHLGELTRRLGRLREAHPHLLAARDYWQRHLPDQAHELAQISDLLASVERELAWGSKEGETNEWLTQAQSRLVEVLPLSRQALDRAQLPTNLLLKLQLNTGRLAFELGKVEKALEHFREAAQTARQAGDENGELHALEFQRAAYTATLKHSRAAEAQRAIDLLVARGAAKNPDAMVASVIARAGIFLARQQLDQADRTLDEAAAISPEGAWRLSLEQHRALARFLRIQGALGSEESIRFADVEDVRDYWQSVLDANASEEQSAEGELRQARSLYYLSRLRYLEWHAARRHWIRVYASPTLGRSVSYAERRAKHEARCLEYRDEVARYNQDAEAYLAQAGGGDVAAASEAPVPAALAEREQQLRIEYQSLKELGARLEDEQKAESISQAQLAGRSARDLSQLLTEAEALAKDSVERLQAASSGSIDGYDPNLHYLALSNQAEILFAQLVTTRPAPVSDETRIAYHETLTRALDALEQALGLMAQPPPTKLGAFADARYFFRSFGAKAPAIVLCANLKNHVRSHEDEVPPDVLKRVRLLAGQISRIQE